MAYKDPAVGRARERFQRRTAERIARGLCPRCGKRPPALGRSVCEPCGEKRNSASRDRDAKLRAAGKPRRDPKRARTYERERDRRLSAERTAQGWCTSTIHARFSGSNAFLNTCAGDGSRLMASTSS